MEPIPEFCVAEAMDPATLKRFLRAVGSRVKVCRGSRWVAPELVELGDDTQIDEGVRIFGGLGVRIGRHVHFAFDSSISGGGECVVEDFASIGAAVRIITGTEETEGGLSNPTVPAEFRKVRRDKVVIGRHAIIFTGAIVLPGVTVGEGAVVSAGSIVHHDLKPWRVYAGTPLVAVRVRDAKPILEAAQRLLDVEQLK